MENSNGDFRIRGMGDVGTHGYIPDGALEAIRISSGNPRAAGNAPLPAGNVGIGGSKEPSVKLEISGEKDGEAALRIKRREGKKEYLELTAVGSVRCV